MPKLVTITLDVEFTVDDDCPLTNEQLKKTYFEFENPYLEYNNKKISQAHFQCGINIKHEIE